MNREYIAFFTGYSLMAVYTMISNEIEFRKLKENIKKIER